MGEQIKHNTGIEQESATAKEWAQGVVLFGDIDSFSKAVETETGRVFDFTSVIQMTTDLIQSSDRYLLLNIKEPDDENNLLFLGEGRSYCFTNNPPSLETASNFGDVLSKAFGHGTLLTFLVLDKTLESYKRQLEIFIERGRKLEEDLDYIQYRNLALELARFNDALEGFHDVLLRLQGSKYKQVETRYISFDYDVLIGESTGLQNRARRRLAVLKDLRQDHDTRATEELNQKIVDLNDAVRKLTAITVILMIPTLLASHFGMNFTFMPELKIWWVYPAVVVFQFVFMGLAFVIFRRKGWL